MKEKRDDDMAIPKQQFKSTTVSNQKVMESAKKVMNKYHKTFEKLAKN
jgi:hypothetical protein